MSACAISVQLYVPDASDMCTCVHVLLEALASYRIAKGDKRPLPQLHYLM